MRAMTNDRDEGETWIDGEIDNTGFGDTRLGDRLRKLMRCLVSTGPEDSAEVGV